MAYDFENIISLISRTGDKFIVDSHGRNFIVMDLAAYEKILKQSKEAPRVQELSEEDLIEKINNDIAEWRQNQDDQEDFLADFKEKKNVMSPSNNSGIDVDDHYYLEPID